MEKDGGAILAGLAAAFEEYRGQHRAKAWQIPSWIQKLSKRRLSAVCVFWQSMKKRRWERSVGM